MTNRSLPPTKLAVESGNRVAAYQRIMDAYPYSDDDLRRRVDTYVDQAERWWNLHCAARSVGRNNVTATRRLRRTAEVVESLLVRLLGDPPVSIVHLDDGRVLVHRRNSYGLHSGTIYSVTGAWRATAIDHRSYPDLKTALLAA